MPNYQVLWIPSSLALIFPPIVVNNMMSVTDDIADMMAGPTQAARVQQELLLAITGPYVSPADHDSILRIYPSKDPPSPDMTIYESTVIVTGHAGRKFTRIVQSDITTAAFSAWFHCIV